MIKKYSLSKTGLNLLKQSEGFSAVVYLCPAGKPTIGYGHVVKSNESFKQPISTELGEALLRADCETAGNYINATAAGKGSLNGSYQLTQNQFDALVLLVFNIGVTAYRESTLLSCLQNGDKTGASEQFLVWDKITVIDTKTKQKVKKVCPGQVSRRARERALFDQSYA
jgi:lysozyme